MNFTELDLRPELLEAINDMGFGPCTPIQEAVIPPILNGKDVSGLAQTGTGKTAAFVVPLIDRILRFRAGETGDRVPTEWKKNSFVLVLVLFLSFLDRCVNAHAHSFYQTTNKKNTNILCNDR